MSKIKVIFIASCSFIVISLFVRLISYETSPFRVYQHTRGDAIIKDTWQHCPRWNWVNGGDIGPSGIGFYLFYISFPVTSVESFLLSKKHSITDPKFLWFTSNLPPPQDTSWKSAISMGEHGRVTVIYP